MFQEAAFGFIQGVIYGGVASVPIIFLSLVFTYLTGERFPSLMGVILGLGILGIGGGLLAVLNQPTVGGVVEVIVASILIVWVVNVGNRLAERIPKKNGSISAIWRRARRHGYLTIKLPDARLINDISGKPRVPEDLKIELSEREFVLPRDLPKDELSNRLKRRLITDWGIGDVEIDLDDEDRVTYFAVAARELGISQTIPSGSVATPIKCDGMPLGLAAGDFVRIYLDNGEVIDRVEVKGVDRAERSVTVLADMDSLERMRNRRASLIVALPTAVRKPVEVKKRSGVIQEFDLIQIAGDMKKAGVGDDLAEAVATRVRARFAKRTSPVPTERIREAVIRELRKKDPKAARLFERYRRQLPVSWVGWLGR
ncbi:MAG: ATP cone domain-containing protein [Candidatus Bathyarchaeia archaeon]